MKSSFLCSFLFLAAWLTEPATIAQKSDGRGVSRAPFSGWPEALVVESRDVAAKAILVPAIGGRIMSYGLGDENVLWVNPETAGKTLATAGGTFNPGGFQGDIGPEIAALPPHPDLWVGPYEWSVKKRHLLAMSGPEDKALPVEIEKEIMFDPGSGELGFQHRIKNTSDRDTAYCLWHRIACRPGGFVLLPLNKRSRFASGWSIRRESGGRYTYDAGKPESPAVRVMDGILVARTGDAATKIGADSAAQWIAYATGRTLFIVHFPVYSSAVYSEAGNTVTVAWDEKMTELQPLSPEARLRPKKSYEFPIKWSLVELPAEITSHEEAQKLAAKVPSSPFE